MNMLPSILEACEYRMQTTKLLNSYITEMAENSISERLIFKIFWGNMPPDPPTGKHWKRDLNLHPPPINLTVIRYVTQSEVIFKTGWKQWQMNHEYRMKFLNESRIIEVKQDRNHESWKSNDSASTPERVLHYTLQSDCLNCHLSVKINKYFHVSLCSFSLDDLEVTDPNDREILLSETAKLASAPSDKSQVLSTNNESQDTVQNATVLDTPLITVSNFDDGDNGPRLVLMCDDDDDDIPPNSNRKISNEELMNQRIINLAYRDGEDSTTDDNSERDFSFKDSEEEHDFGK